MKRKRNGEGTITSNGYLFRKANGIRLLEHRRLWEEHYEETIPSGYEIHHLDGNKLNNSLENLQLLSHRSHMRLHRGWIEVKNQWWKVCSHCGELKSLSDYYVCEKYGTTQNCCKVCKCKEGKERRYILRKERELRCP